MKMIKFRDFKSKWQNMPDSLQGYLTVDVSHPLEFKMGYSGKYKSLVIMNSGKLGEITPTFAVQPINKKLGNGKWILEFRLLHHSFEEEFLRLCWDMIECSQDSNAPVQDLIRRYYSWQKLLQNKKKNILSFQSQKGLIGELLFLKEVIGVEGPDLAVQSWVGPDGSDQDFIFGDTWREIKSVSAASESVKISSLQQLNQSVDGKLIVYTLEKTSNVANGINLASIKREIDIVLKPYPRLSDLFSMKLFKYGYRESEVTEYQKNTFRYMGKKGYLVNAVFPKLTCNNVASEIVSCSYSISLSAIEKYRSDD